MLAKLFNAKQCQLDHGKSWWLKAVAANAAATTRGRRLQLLTVAY